MEFIKRNLLQITLLALVGVYLYTRLPFFLKYLVPGFHVDTFTYYYPAWLMRNGLWGEIRNMPTDLPMGYPFFLALLYKVPNIGIVVIQSLFQLFASLFLLWTSFRYFGKYAAFLGLLILAYSFDSNLIGFETNLYTESLFTSFIFLFIATFIKTLYKPSAGHLIPLFLITTILVLIRPNGLLFLAGPALILILHHKDIKLRKFLLVVYLTQFLFLSVLNFGIKGYFFPVEAERYEKVVVSTLNHFRDEQPSNPESPKPTFTPKGILLVQNLEAFSTEYSSFYYSRIPSLIDQFEQRKYYDAFDARFPLPDSLRFEILKDIKDYRVDQMEKPNLDQKNYLYLIHLFNKAHTIFIKNKLVLALFSLPAFLVLFLLFKRRKMQKEGFLYLVAVFFYFINIVFSTMGHTRFQARYINTFDVFVYFGLFMLFVLAMNHFQAKKSPEGAER